MNLESLNLESILGLLGGGAGVFILKAYTDWRQAKRGDTQDVVGAWQQIADRESSHLTQLNTRVLTLEKSLLEKEVYINQLERLVVGAGLQLPAEITSAANTDGGAQ